MQAAADWLQASVGVGGVFTKAQLRAAFPDVSQIDRRVRDLRARGWVIHTRREDPTLKQMEMRLVEVGDLSVAAPGIPSTDRRAALLQWAYSCCLCGVGSGENYRDAAHVRVQLSVVRSFKLCDSPVPICRRCEPALNELEGCMKGDLPPGVAEAASLPAEQWRLACLQRIRNRLREQTGE
jgi:hypothetical protein